MDSAPTRRTAQTDMTNMTDMTDAELYAVFQSPYARLPEPTKKVIKIRTRALLAEKAGELVVIPEGEMLVADGRILAVGGKLTHHVDETLDWTDSFVAPGFVDLNALGDIDHHLIWSEQKRPEKLFWSKDYVEGGTEESMTAGEEAFKSLFAYVQLLRRGVTSACPITCTYYKAAGETYGEIAAAAKHAAHLGLRAWLGVGFLGAGHVWDEEAGRRIVMPLPDDGRPGFEAAKRFVGDFADYGGGLITTMMTPERIELQSDAVLREVGDFCREHDLLLKLHAAQSEFEWRWTRETLGCTPVEHLERLELLNDRLLLPHAAWTTGSAFTDIPGDADLVKLARAGTAVIHCPLVYGRTGASLDNFGRYKAAGIRMTMGSDTFPPDPFMIMRVGQMFALSHTGGNVENARFIDYWDAYTRGGADALRRPDLGRLTEGARADFIRIPMTNPWLGTFDDPVRTLAMAAAATDITDVWVEGRPIVEAGRVLGIRPEAMSALQAAGERYHEKLKAGFVGRSALKDAVPFWD